MGGAPILERPHILSHRTASHYAKTSDGTLSVTRRQVAEHFGKQHKNVLQSIGNLECSDEFARLNFQPSEYLDDKDEARTEYAMARDGFTSSVTFATSSRKTLNGVSDFGETPYLAPLNGQTYNMCEMFSDGSVTVASRQVAEHFGKQHKDVLRAIRILECSNDFTERNFAPSEYVDVTGGKLPQMLMFRDGFTFLVMGFTGKDAAHWKEKFIAAFNAMEERLLPEHAQEHRCIVQTHLRLPSSEQTRPHPGDVPRSRPSPQRTAPPQASQQELPASALRLTERGGAQRQARDVVESEVFSPCSPTCATQSIIPLRDNPISVYFLLETAQFLGRCGPHRENIFVSQNLAELRNFLCFSREKPGCRHHC